MSTTTVAPVERAAAVDSLPQFLRVPLLHCRHYVRNYFDLFLDLLGRIYSAGGVDDDVIVEPGDTFGEALNITEQIVADALVKADADGGESVLLALIRTILTDEGVAEENLDGLIENLVGVLKNGSLPTFRQKAHDLDDALTRLAAADLISLTQSQIDHALDAFRSIGKVVADLLAFEFPELKDYRQDLFKDPERYLLLSGPYHAVVSNDPKEVLSCSFANDRITIELRFKSLNIAESANFEFFKVKEKKNKTVTKEKHEVLMSALGALSFRDVAIKLVLDDTLDPAEPYPWAPGHDVRRAQWTRPSVRIEVESVDLDLHSNSATVLLSFLEFYWGSVQKLEEDIEEGILNSVNSQGDIAGLADITNEYVTPIAQVIIPISHALSKVRIADPFEGLVFPNEVDSSLPPGLQRAAGPGKLVAHSWDPTSHMKFDSLKTIYEARAVSIRNLQPEPPEVESIPFGDDEVRLPDNLDDLDPGKGTWAWPAQGGGGFTQLDLDNVDDRVFAINVLAQTTDLTTRTRAIAALSVEGFSPNSIGVLRSTDFDAAAGTVYGRAVGPGTLALLDAAQSEGKAHGATEFLFKYDDFTGSVDLVEAELRSAQYRIAQFGLSGTGWIPPEKQVLVPNFDSDIWDMKYQDRTTLKASRGTPSDPGWIGLSTNCVVATTLYRKLKDQKWFKKSGEARYEQGKITYELHDCVDVVADFSGDAPGNAPAVAIHDLRIVIGTPREGTFEYNVDLRLRLNPYIYGHGCLPDDAVTHVSDSLRCIEDMTGGKVNTTQRLHQIDFRDFVVLRADFEKEDRDIQVVNINEIGGANTVSGETAEARIRAAIAHWFPTVPEPPVLYNSFRSVGGANRNFNAEKGWLSFYRRYPFPNFSEIDLKK